MTHVRPITAGLALGLFAVATHAAWSLLVLSGWAQPLIDFVFRLHMLQPTFHVAAFDWATAAGLLVYAAAAGFIFGAVLAACWNGFVRVAAGEPAHAHPRASVHGSPP
jgi:hypothetical protein